MVDDLVKCGNTIGVMDFYLFVNGSPCPSSKPILSTPLVDRGLLGLLGLYEVITLGLAT